MRKNYFLRSGFLAAAILAGLSGTVHAQSAIVRGETSPGVYDNIPNIPIGSGSIAVGVNSLITQSMIRASGAASAAEALRSVNANAGSTSIGVLTVQSYQGFSSSLNITAATTLKAITGRIFKVIVNTAGSSATLVCDSNTTCSAVNVIMSIPASSVGIFDINFPILTGIRIEPGTGAVLSASYQ